MGRVKKTPRPAANASTMPLQTPELNIAYRIFGPGLNDETVLNDVNARLDRPVEGQELRAELCASLGITPGEFDAFKAQNFQAYLEEIRRMKRAEETSKMSPLDIAHHVWGRDIESPGALYSKVNELDDGEAPLRIMQDLGLCKNSDATAKHAADTMIQAFEAYLAVLEKKAKANGPGSKEQPIVVEKEGDPLNTQPAGTGSDPIVID